MKLYSVNGIAVELGLDRRVVALRLSSVKPEGKTIRGHNGWTLKTFWALAAGDSTKADNAGSYAAERVALIREKRRLAELERARIEGSLLPADQVQKTWTAIVSIIRHRLLALPASLALKMSAEKDPIKTQSMLTTAIHQALRELASVEITSRDQTAELAQ